MRLTRWSVMLAVLAAMALVLPATVPTVAQNRPRPQTYPYPIVAQVTTGGGASYMHVEVNRQGNLRFESGGGLYDGYAVCRPDRSGESMAYAYNLPLDDVMQQIVGLGPVTVTQPHPGSFPVTIVRDTKDGRLRLSMKFPAPDPTEKLASATMTVRNISASPTSDLRIMRTSQGGYQYDNDFPPFFMAATTADSVFQWSDNDANGTANGVVMMARSVGKPHEAGMSDDIDLALNCGGFNEMDPNQTGGGQAQVVYFLPTLAPGAEWTMSFGYRRL